MLTNHSISIIDDALKNRIQEIGIAPTNKTEIHFWIKEWISFCFQALIEDVLDKSFNRILDNNIIRQQETLSENDIDRFAYLNDFFTELLIYCNKDFAWFDEVILETKEIKEVIDSAIKDHSSYHANRKKLKIIYENYCKNWLENKIHQFDNEQNEIFYKKSFDVFWMAYRIGLLSDFTCQKIVEAIIEESINEKTNTLAITQDNCQIIYRYFINILKKNNLIPTHLTLCELPEFIKILSLENIENIISDSKINNIFNASLRGQLIEKNISFYEKIKNLSLTVSNHNEFHSKEKNSLLDLIAINKFETIQVRCESEVIFLYSKMNGTTINKDLLDPSQLEQILLFNRIAQNEEVIFPLDKTRFFSSYAARNLDSRLYQLAKHVIENQTDEFFIDHLIEFSKLGQIGIKIYLSVLDQKLADQLRNDHINKCYSLCLSKEINQYTLQGIIHFLKEKIKQNNSYVFCCQTVTMTINPSHFDSTNLSINALGELIQLLDKSNLSQLNLITSHLEPSHLEALSNAFHLAKHMVIRLGGAIPIDEALRLESINDTQLQPNVPYRYTEEAKNTSLEKRDISRQLTPIGLMKIKALMDNEVHLKPIQGKIGTQNQRHYQQQNQQQKKDQILQSWQIDQKKQTTHETSQGYAFLYGTEEATLISWHDIDAAFNPDHPNHEHCRIKLGEEIIHYEFKGRNLIDLWQRLTGNVVLTNQHIIPDETNKTYHFYSSYIPTRISHKTLLTIVRYPHLFQAGVHIESLPEFFNFDHGALFTNVSKSQSKPNPFTLHFSHIPQAGLPNTEHFYRLKNSKIPSQSFFHRLGNFIPEYHAWHAWRCGFVSLNSFNQEGINALCGLIEKNLETINNIQDSLDFIDYVIQALNYHYRKKIKQQSILTLKQTQFEYQLQQDYQQGINNRLSSTKINQISGEIRENFLKSLIFIFNRSDFGTHEILKDEALACQQLLIDTISYHQNKLPDKINNIPFIKSDILSQLLEILGYQTNVKLLELTLSNDSSVVYNIFSMLQDIYYIWGKVGVTDFNHCFLSTTINLSPLAEPQHQQAIVQLLQLSETEYHWWQQLTLQHAEHSGFSEFFVLMRAFQHFLSELKTLDLYNYLSIPFPLDGIHNMQIGLNRVISVLMLSKKQKEQFQSLENLDWGAHGIICAIKKQKYQFVHRDMELNFSYELDFHRFITQESLFYLEFYHHDAVPYYYSKLTKISNEEDKQKIFKFTIGCFYRYIGSQTYTAPIKIYQQLLSTISFPKNYKIINHVHGTCHSNGKLQKEINPKHDIDLIIMSAFLPIIACATTGRRGLDKLPQQPEKRARQLKQFIQAAYEFSRARYPHNLELDQFLINNNAVSYENLISCLSGIKELYDRHELTGHVSPDFEELSLVLRLIKNSVDTYYELTSLHNNLDEQLAILKKEIQCDFTGIFNRSDNQLLYARILLKNYSQYFIDALTRFNQYNKKSDFACFLMIGKNFETTDFSLENKSRLLRLLSIIRLTIQQFCVAARQIDQFLKQLRLYQEKFGNDVLDKLLSKLSLLVPDNNTALEIEDLQKLLENSMIIDNYQDNVDLDFLIKTHVPYCHIDPILDEIKDIDFYSSPEALDHKFSGLGIFFDAIRGIVLQRYPVSSNNQKLEAWQNFLSMIEKIESNEKRHQILDTLLKVTHHNIDLTTLNRWLSVLLNQNNERPHFEPDYFTSLNESLINHSNNQEFIFALNDWMNYSYWVKKESHIGFICLLNKLSTTQDGFLCLNQLSKIAKKIAVLFNSDGYVWHVGFVELISMVKNQNISIDSLNKVLMILTKFFDFLNQNEEYQPYIKKILSSYLSNVEKSFLLILNFSNQWDDNLSDQTFKKLFILFQLVEFELDLKWVSEFLEKMDIPSLEKLANCYQTFPIPTSKTFQLLVEKKITLDEFIKQHCCDPHHERDVEKLKQQFNNNLLWPYLNRIKYLHPKQTISSDITKAWYNQLCFLNYIGYEKIRHFSLTEIQETLHQCKKALVDITDENERLTVYLTALALIREAVYKTSQFPAILWPTAIQILAILSVINRHTSAPLFLKKATGEGKSLLIVFLSILAWLKENNVCIVTHRESIGLRDSKIYGQLFKNLGIECDHLSANHFLNKAHIDQLLKKNNGIPGFKDICYVEFNELSHIFQQLLLNMGISVDNMSFIIDEADEIVLHNQTDNNSTQLISSDDIHPYAWVFEALATYIDQLSIKNDPISIRIVDIIHYLEANFPFAVKTCQEIDFLTKLPVYVEAAWQAKFLKERDDFIIKPKQKNSDEYYASVLIGDNPMPSNVTFQGLVQQALHGRLNNKEKEKKSNHYFPITSETIIFSSMDTKSLLEKMKKCGEVILLSATIGSNSELQEMQLDYDFNYIQFPKKQHSLRTDYPIQFCENQQKQLAVIAELCNHYTKNRTQHKSRSILIVAEDIEFSEILNQFLLNYSNHFNLHVLNAEREISDQTINELEYKVGQSGQILIAVSGLISRGFDIKLNSATQVVVITTYLKNGVDEIQVKGRASRIDIKTGTGRRLPGKFYAVYDSEKETKRFNIKNQDINPEIFKQNQYFAYYQQESAFRLQRQLIGIAKNAIQTHFFELWKLLFKNESISKEIRDKILNLFTRSLEKIVTIMPTDNLSEYNKKVLSIYQETLINVQYICHTISIENIDIVINNLLKEIENRQQKLINNHQSALATGPNSPTIPVYKQWKPGEKLNAHLNSGKQKMGNYVHGMFNYWWLSSENKTKIQGAMKNLEIKISYRKKKKSEFLSQLKEIMFVNIQEYPTIDFIHIYQKIFKSESIQLISSQAIQYSSELNQTALVTKKYRNQGTISFIHDPLSLEISKICLVSNNFDFFNRLQHSIHKIYEEYNITSELNFHITLLNDTNPSQYQIIIDFSSHSFDLIDREKMLSSIANDFDMDVKSLVEIKHLPSLKAMVTVLQELHNKLQVTSDEISGHLMKFLPMINQSLSRIDYYKCIFMPSIMLLNKNYNKLHVDIKACVNALLNYHKTFDYQNYSGKKCRSYSIAFENIATLLENEKKRHILDLISEKLTIFYNHSLSDSLLFRKQAEYFIQLTIDIAHSTPDETLESIYQKWKNKNIRYLQENITIYDLMQRRSEKATTLWGVSKSPNVFVFCKELDRKINVELEKPIENKINYI